MIETKKVKKEPVEVTQEIIDMISAIPKCSIGAQQDEGLVQNGIKVFYIIGIVVRAVIDGDITIVEMLRFYKALIAFKVNHIFTYWGGKDYETVDALLQGVRTMSLLTKIKEGSKMVIAYNDNITEAGKEMAMAYSYGTVGRLYGFPDFAGFVTRLAKLVFPKIPNIEPSNYMDHCAENGATTQDVALTRKLKTISNLLCPDKTPRSHVHPQDIVNYWFSAEGKNNGWRIVFDNRNILSKETVRAFRI